jgi:GTP-binding protein HflX
VEAILLDLGLREKPRITVLNKVDLALDSKQNWTEDQALEFIREKCGPVEPNTVLVSATRKWGLKSLLETISQILESPSVREAAPEIPA